jgi:hypothetical protein
MNETETAIEEQDYEAQAAVAEAADQPALVLPAEAGFSLNWTMLDADGCNVQITMRAAHVTGWKDVMVERHGFIARALKAGWTTRGVKAAPETTPAERAADLGHAAPSQPAAAQAPKPANGNGHAPVSQAPVAAGKQVIELVAAKVEIAPQPDGKVKLNFFEAGHKYPDIYAVKPAAAWSQMLNWDVAEFGKVQAFEGLAMKVGYTLSDKLNSVGNPYKDLAYIKAA